MVDPTSWWRRSCDPAISGGPPLYPPRTSLLHSVARFHARAPHVNPFAHGAPLLSATVYGGYDGVSKESPTVGALGTRAGLPDVGGLELIGHEFTTYHRTHRTKCGLHHWYRVHWVLSRLCPGWAQAYDKDED